MSQLGTNDSAVKIMGDKVLSAIARELVETVRNNLTIDWTLRETSEPDCAHWSNASCASTTTPQTNRRQASRICGEGERERLRVFMGRGEVEVLV